MVRVLAALGLAVIGTTIAVFAFPLMRNSDALRRDGLRVAATVVKLEDETCSYSGYRRRAKFPCFKATAEWTHDGLVYRGVVGYPKRRDAMPLGTKVEVVFAPDPAAVAGEADLRFRALRAGDSELISEQPIYLGILALAGLMCMPVVSMLFRTLFARK